MAQPLTPLLKLYYWGRFRAEIEGNPLTGFRARKAQALLAYLALEGGEEQRRSDLARLLWHGYQEETALASLRVTLSNLRQLLAPLDPIISTRFMVRWRSTPLTVWSDVAAPEQGVPPGTGHFPAPAQSAGERESGEFLAGFETIDSLPFQEWLQNQRQRRRSPMMPPGLGDGRPTTPTVAVFGALPQAPALFGRQAELATLTQWVTAQPCRLVAILGLGGLGKTVLVGQLVRTLAAGADVGASPAFAQILCSSLVNAPPVAQVIQGWLQRLSPAPLPTLPDQVDAQLALLLDQLRRTRALLVLDNLESVLQQGEQAGHFRPGYEGYGELLQQVGNSDHQSVLLLTSRERPQPFTALAQLPTTQTLLLSGLDPVGGGELLHAQGLVAADPVATKLIAHYDGNPLALQLVAQAIRDLFAGNIAAFLAETPLLFADIRTVLDQHFARLSPLEQEILLWLAIEREPVALLTIWPNLVAAPAKSAFLAACYALQQRLLLQPYQDGFSLQNVVMEYLTEHLVAQMVQALATEELETTPSARAFATSSFNRFALMKAQSKSYVQESQRRMLLQPVAEQLVARLGKLGVEKRCQALLARLRSVAPRLPGYTAANIFHLLCHLAIDLQGYDFSQLAVWQANLHKVRLPAVNFAQAEFKHTVFTAPFTGIISLAFFPDNQHMAVGTHTGTILLWRLADQLPCCILSGHTDYVFLALSPDGKRLASASSDGTLRLWDLSDLAQTTPSARVLVQQTMPLRAVAFSPDGKTLASGSDDGLVCLCNGVTGAWERVLYRQTTPVLTLAFGGGDGELLASAGHGDIYLWDRRQDRLAATWRGHSTLIWSLAFSPNGRLLASGSVDQTVRLWQMAGRAPVGDSPGQTPPSSTVLTGHSAHIYSVAFSPDGTTLASGSFDQTVRLWEVASGRTQAVLGQHTSWVRAVAFSPDGKTLVSGSNDHTIKLWQLQAEAATAADVATSSSGQLQTTLVGHASAPRTVAFSPNGKTLASGHADEVVRLWNVQTGALAHSLTGHVGLIYAVTFAPDGHQLASVGNDAQVRLWDLPSGRLTQRWPGYHGTLRAVAFSPDGKTLAVGGNRPWLQLWNAETGQLQHTLRAPLDQVWSVAFAPSRPPPPGVAGRLLATGTHTQSVLLWDTNDGALVGSLWGAQNAVLSVAFHPAGRWLAGGGVDGRVYLWDVASGRLLHTLGDGGHWFFSVAFSPSGKLLAGGASGGVIHLWQIEESKPGELTIEPRHQLHGHRIEVNSVAFSPDGRYLASAASDETIRLWDVESGERLHTLQAPGPYAGMNIRAISGVTHAQTVMLKTLGAVD